MAEDSDLEKTESASPRRLEQAREEGQVPQSRELAAFLVLMAGAAGLWLAGGWFAQRLGDMLRHGLTLERDQAFDTSRMGLALESLATEALVTIAPVLVALLVAVFIAPFLMGGWVFSPKALSADFTRLSPLKGFGRMFSLNSLAELTKAVLKAGIIGGMALWVVLHHHEEILSLSNRPLSAALAEFGHVIGLATVTIVAGFALIAALDVPWQLWQYYKNLRMTKEEVRQEGKEMEGDPHVKARIRGLQREAARRRMMSEVPKADVVVTNPTHFSVALKYDSGRNAAPRVIAKGAGLVALKIREIAAGSKVPLVEAPPLARALHRHCDIGDEIPATLYTAVAEVLAYIYQLNHWMAHGGRAPEAPSALLVPADMDPGVAA